MFLHEPGVDAACIVQVLGGNHSFRNSSIDLHVMPKELDVKVETMHFPALGEVLTVLARQHADYTGVKGNESPFKGEHRCYCSVRSGRECYR